MITELNAEKLIELGERHRADYLVEQSGYTQGIAAKEGSPLAALLPANYLTEVRAETEKVSTAMKDKTLVASESKNSTTSQNQALANAKVWRTKVVHRCRRAERMGKDMPEELTRTNDVRNVPAVAGQIDKMVKLLEANKANLMADTTALVTQGQSIAKALKEADAGQEVKRLRDLPEAVRAFYQSKGTLYMGLKAINDAGRELYAATPDKAAIYNLSILRRHYSPRKENGKQEQVQESK